MKNTGKKMAANRTKDTYPNGDLGRFLGLDR
jgi:hypothetical protein